MTGPRRSLAANLGIGLVAAATTWVTLTAWRDFVTEPSSYLDQLVVVALLVATLGALLRWRAVPRMVIVTAQAVATAALVSYQITGSPVFLGAAGNEIWQAITVAVDSARTYAAPISPQAPPVWPLMLLGGAAFLLLVDVIAATFRKIPGAGLALLAIYSVPSGLLDRGPGWGTFVVATLGFLTLLHLDTREQEKRWGQVIGPNDDAVRWVHTSPVLEAARAGAGRIALVATTLAVVVPGFVPGLDVEVFQFGDGDGNGDIRIRKPITDMRRDLERERDVPLVYVETDDPDPDYLRISVLNRFTGQEWSSGDRDVARDDTATGELPPPAGMAASVPRREYAYAVEITDQLDSTWLPTQFPASAVVADGDWRFDPASMDFLAADDDLDTRDLDYRMIALEPEFGTDGRYFRDAATGAVAEELLELPNGVPKLVRDLAEGVTEPAANDYERALLLQRWFRRDGGFTYDLSRAPEGTGNGTLEAFLSEDGRVGYCEQYASAMAVMARVLGIPARVAVGFLEPESLGGGRWEYSSHDLHAWPELYFAGTGWVRFEPTPAGRAETVPAYSRVPVGASGSDLPTGGPSQAPQSSDGAAPAVPNPQPTEQTDAGGTDSAEGDGNGPLIRLLLVLLGVAATIGLLLAGAFGPRAVRRRQRQRRLAGGPEQLWAEVRATARDLGVPWPEGRSPREIGAALITHLGDPDAELERPRTGAAVAPQAAEAVERLVAAIERVRYARPGTVATLERTTLAEDATTVLAALAAGVDPQRRRRASWAPRSIWSR